MENLNNKTIIKNISTDQSEILHNIGTLYNNGSDHFDCDITASSLGFYGGKKKDKFAIPEPKILMDVYPTREDIIKITPFEKLPLNDNSIHSVVVDLPFVISPKKAPSATTDIKDGSNLIFKRFSSWYPAMEGYENMYWWLKECARVIDNDGIIVWKMQSTVSGGINHWFAPFCFMCAQHFGLYVIDEFILQAKARLISPKKYNKQCHARKYTSTFFVFKKEPKTAEKTNCLNILKHCILQDESRNLEGKVWVEKGRKKKEKLAEKPADAVEQPTVRKEHHKRQDYHIAMYSKDGEFIKEFHSYSDVIKEIPISQASLSQCFHGRIKSSNGYIWKKIIVY